MNFKKTMNFKDSECSLFCNVAEELSIQLTIKFANKISNLKVSFCLKLNPNVFKKLLKNRKAHALKSKIRVVEHLSKKLRIKV